MKQPMWKRLRTIKHNRDIRRRTALIMPRGTARVAMLVVSVAVFVWVLAVVWACAEDAPERYAVAVEAGSVLNFRADPSTDGKILYQLGAGNIVTVHRTANRGEWALVTWIKLEPLSDPQPAWVCAKYLRPATDAEIKEACRDIASLMDSSRQSAD